MAFVIIMILFDVKDYRLHAIWFDIVEFRENIHMTVKIVANVHQLMFLVLKFV